PRALGVPGGLEAALSAGTTHRDNNPANILVPARGHAKILDFGRAKLAGSASVAPAGRRGGKEAGEARREDSEAMPAVPEDTPTASIDSEHLTSPGSLLGTAAYMSPEQARGQKLDARTDLFSFGAVLYEMATGRQPFACDTLALMFDGLLNRDPIPPSHFNPRLSAAFDALVAHLLEKDRSRRY